MLKKILLAVINMILYILCVLFSFSSFFVVLSFSHLKTSIFNNEIVLILTFCVSMPVSFILGHHLNRLFLVLRQPIQEWKNGLLKR